MVLYIACLIHIEQHIHVQYSQLSFNRYLEPVHTCLSFSLTIDTIDKNLDVVLAGLRVDLSC